MTRLGRPPIDPAGAGRRVHVVLTPTSDAHAEKLMRRWKCNLAEAIRRALAESAITKKKPSP